MSDTKTKIVLRGGPWDGHAIDDSGAETLQMCVATKYDESGVRAAKGARVGRAIYEPNKERTEAFWLTNQWDGTSLGGSSKLDKLIDDAPEFPDFDPRKEGEDE